MSVRIGVVAVQGAVSEHEVALGMAAGLEGIETEVVTLALTEGEQLANVNTSQEYEAITRAWPRS